jgi:mannose-6-phosphate isomerase-like protein (cupin superfamily)
MADCGTKKVSSKTILFGSKQLLSHEYRPWGYYIVLYETEDYKIKQLTINPKGRTSLQQHKKRAEYWVIISGEPIITLYDTNYHLKPGETITIPKEAEHRIANNTYASVKIIEIQTGEYFGEDDIKRLQDDYDRIDNGNENLD